MFDLLLANGDSSSNVGLIGLVVWVVLGILQFILFIAALISIVGSRRYTGGGKFLWVVVVFFAPLLGAIGWFVAGRSAQIRTSVE